MESSFIKQIKEDIADYQSQYSYIKYLSKDEWAFNFWVLDKLYNIDEQLIESQIIDYNDVGVDCFVWHEDERDLFLIQNKFYSEETKLSGNYFENNFLLRPLGALENGTYSHCEELQDIFTKYKDDPNFTVYLNLYITNNSSKSQKLVDSVEKYNSEHIDKHCICQIFWLDDIEELYYQEPREEKKSMTFLIESCNKGTILNINPKDYKLKQKVDAKYVFTPILNLYQLYIKSEKENYPLFESNIREYLGLRGTVNKGIRNTLLDDDDRENFFYYNNGITMIVKDIGNIEAGEPTTIKVTNPQIVNGCQTVSTIYKTLSKLPEEEIERKFKDTYVMLKILKIPKNNTTLDQISKNIVRFNNSQNSLDTKAFESVTSEFIRIQSEFLRKGFLVCIKQSDQHKFGEQYKNISLLLKENQILLDKFGLTGIKTAKNLMIPLIKLLQIYRSFDDAHDAIVNKSKFLVCTSSQYKEVYEFIRNPNITINEQIHLLLLYLRVEQERKSNPALNTINPYMLINCFAINECDSNPGKITSVLNCKENVDSIIGYYNTVLTIYFELWTNNNRGKGYNDMVKNNIDPAIMKTAIRVTEASNPIKLK